MGFHDPQLNVTTLRSRRSKGKGMGNWVRALLTRLKSTPSLPPPPPFRTPATQAKIYNFLSLKLHDSQGYSMN